jgi:hypothetical protein
MSDDRIIMPWGKFKGQYLDLLPSSYLKWLSENCDWDDTICEEADKEWRFRDHYNTHIRN